MSTEKISISLSTRALRFIETYLGEHKLRSRSQVIEHAIRILMERQLENDYRCASREIDPAWETSLLDGLSDETW